MSAQTKGVLLPNLPQFKSTTRRCYTLAEAAERLGFSSGMIPGLVKFGLLHPFRLVGSHAYYFPHKEIEQLRRTLRTEYMSSVEAKEILGVGQGTVEDWYKTGRLGSLRLSNRTWVVNRKDVRQLRHEMDRCRSLVASHQYLTYRQAVRFRGINGPRLRGWCHEGLVRYVTTPTHQRLYHRQDLKRMQSLFSNHYIGLDEAAAILDVNKVTVWRWTKLGRFNTVVATKKWKRYLRKEVERLGQLRRKSWLTLEEASELMMTPKKGIQWMVRQGILASRVSRSGQHLFDGRRAEELTSRALAALNRFSTTDAEALWFDTRACPRPNGLHQKILGLLIQAGGAVYHPDGDAVHALARTLRCTDTAVNGALYHLRKKRFIGYEAGQGSGTTEIWLKPAGWGHYSRNHQGPSRQRRPSFITYARLYIQAQALYCGQDAGGSAQN